jgi:hypothetical protein
MGLPRDQLPDALLKRVAPTDRTRLRLPPPLSEIVSASTAKSDLKRERDLQIQIVSWLRIRGHTVLWSAMHRKLTCTVSWPDITFALKGQAVALEAKLPGQKPTEDQRRMMLALICDGWLVKVVHSLDEARAVVAEAEKDG